MSTSFIRFPKEGAEGAGQHGVQMLELALPIPLDQQEKVRALNYLHGAVQQYIDDFCSGNPDGRPAPAGRDAAGPAPPSRRTRRTGSESRARKKSGVSLPQAIQVFLCFYLCLFI